MGGAAVGSRWVGAVAGPRENEIGAAAGRHACVCEERGAEGDVRANCEEEVKLATVCQFHCLSFLIALVYSLNMYVSSLVFNIFGCYCSFHVFNCLHELYCSVVFFLFYHRDFQLWIHFLEMSANFLISYSGYK